MTTASLPTRRVRSVPARIGFAALAAGLLGAAVAEAAAHGGGWWQLPVFGMGPDIALVAGFGAGLARGQLHPRAVRPYNALHRAWGPFALLAAASAGLVPGVFVVGGLAWAFHIAMDRAAGYGLRTPEGFVRA
jgi:uncharacterized protein DUF4260